LACTLPGYFTDAERDMLNTLMVVVASIGLPMIALVIITWLSSKLRMTQQYLILWFICLSAFFTIWIIVTAAVSWHAGADRDRLFCRGNAVALDQSDGISICVVQAAVILYCFLAISLTWTIQCIELFRKIILRNKAVKSKKWVHALVIFGMPGFGVLWAALRNMLGYGRVLPFCLIAYTAPANVDFGFLYLPMFILAVIGVFFMVSVIGKTVVSSNAVVPHVHHEGNRVFNRLTQAPAPMKRGMTK